MATHARPSVLCSGGCGRLLWVGSTSAEHPVCRSCRRWSPGRYGYEFPSPNYATIHGWLNATLGPASERTCRFCSRPAAHWAYDHADSDERRDPFGANAARPFSVWVNHYMPLCRSHHTRWDNEHRQRWLA
jgi:hypothetical protein